MKKDFILKYKIAIIVCIIALVVVPSTYAILKSSLRANGKVALATWDVSLNQTGVNGALTIVPEVQNADYTLNVTSNAEVDIRYSIIISNLPSGVDVSLDNGTFQSQVNNTVSFADVGTILYSDVVKNKTHTLTFRANNGATVVNNQTVNIDVIIRQIV